MVEGAHRVDVSPADGAGFQPLRRRTARRLPRPRREHRQPVAVEPGEGDPTCIFGIPPAEMTGHVRAALEGLLARFDEVNRQLQGERDREAYLQGLADGDAVLLVGNRRYLIRELSRVIARSRVSQTLNSFLIISIANAAEVRLGLGEAAVHALLCDAAGDKAEGLVAALAAPPLVWNGAAVSAAPRWGLSEVRPDDAADDVIAAADRDLLARARRVLP